jgi:hypothetical protein
MFLTPEEQARKKAQPRLTIVPMSLREANAFVTQSHRHHKPARGHKFSIGVHDGEHLVGVAIVGRPVARAYDNGRTLEVNRTCTDGTPNANSALYGAAWRIAREMGYVPVFEAPAGVSWASGLPVAAGQSHHRSSSTCEMKSVTAASPAPCGRRRHESLGSTRTPDRRTTRSWRHHLAGAAMTAHNDGSDG